jgi:molybdopterin-guanine dinucleotide biosynthesis protein A
MGGQDKGLIQWHGKPLIGWVQEIARPFTDDLLISCNRNLDAYAHFADRLVTDSEPTFPGPLAGIRAGLAAARHDRLLVLPCDAPLIDKMLLAQLLESTIQMSNHPIMLRRGKQWEPLFCVIPTCLTPDIEAAWQAGERSNREILLRLGARSLQLSDDDPRLANLNSPDLLANQPAPEGT